MDLSITIIFSWIVGISFLFVKKRLSFIQNVILFMITATIARNTITILSLQLDLIKTTESNILFILFLFHREILIPLIILFVVNRYLLSEGWFKKCIWIVIGMTALHIVDRLMVGFKLLDFVNWTFFGASVINLIYIVSALLVGKGLLFIEKREIRKYGRSL